MNNPILEQLSKTQATHTRNNPIEMVQQFNQFKKTMQGKNPQQIVMGLLNSGAMSQQQFEELKKQAQTLQGFLK